MNDYEIKKKVLLHWRDEWWGGMDCDRCPTRQGGAPCGLCPRWEFWIRDARSGKLRLEGPSVMDAPDPPEPIFRSVRAR